MLIFRLAESMCFFRASNSRTQHVCHSSIGRKAARTFHETVFNYFDPWSYSIPIFSSALRWVFFGIDMTFRLSQHRNRTIQADSRSISDISDIHHVPTVLTLYLATMLVAPMTWLLSIVSVDVGWYSAPSWSSCVVEKWQNKKRKNKM